MTLEEYKEIFLEQWEALMEVQRALLIPTPIKIRLDQFPEEFQHAMFVLGNKLQADMIKEFHNPIIFKSHREHYLESTQ